jgi:putative endonuclease
MKLNLRMDFVAWVYIITTRMHTVFYTGYTTDIRTRMWEHRTKQNPNSFSARYSVYKLVYFQGFLSVNEAREAERFIKGKTREWKKALITDRNPRWKDLTLKLER